MNTRLCVISAALLAGPAGAAPSLEARVSGSQIGSTNFTQAQYSGSALDLYGRRGSEPWLVYARAQSDWGVIKLDGQAALVGSSSATGAFYDDITITAPGIANGTLGTLSYSVMLDADLSISNSRSSAFWTLRTNLGNDGLYDLDLAAGLCGSNMPCSGTTQPGSHTATVNFVFGEEMPLSVWLRGDAQALAQIGSEPASVARYELGHSLYWGGIAAVSVNGALLDDYSLVTASGNDWRASFLPSPVPEPGSAALALAGLGVLGWLRRRRADQSLTGSRQNQT